VRRINALAPSRYVQGGGRSKSEVESKGSRGQKVKGNKILKKRKVTGMMVRRKAAVVCEHWVSACGEGGPSRCVGAGEGLQTREGRLVRQRCNRWREVQEKSLR
jgi:hypothetical protein